MRKVTVMKIIHSPLMWTKTDDNRIFLMTENPYTKRRKSSRKSPVILHTEPNTTDGLEAMRTYIAGKFASAIIIEDDDTSVIAEALRTVYFD